MDKNDMDPLTRVIFKFDMGVVVRIVPLGVKGVVTMLGFDRGGCQYFVRTAATAGWFYENQLTKVEEGK